MAVFTPKTSEEILRDAINYLYLNTNLSDFNVGSVVRTILEVMSIEDAEQYFQMYNILQSFFLKSASGAALDDRAAQYNVSRIPSTPSTGNVVFLDTNLKRSFLTSPNGVTAGVATFSVVDVTAFPSPPFVVQLGESTNSVEQVQISVVDTTNNQLTIDAAAVGLDPYGNPFNAMSNPHPQASTGVDEFDNMPSLVCYVNSGSAARIVPSGITLRAEPTNVTMGIECVTTRVTTHSVGFFASNSAPVRSTSVGVSSNVPTKRLNQIVGGSPYSGAAVVNGKSISGGANAETDSALRTRIRNRIASLSAGTKRALVDGLLQTSDASTNQIISRVNIVEEFDKRVVWAYVDDASASFNPTYESTYEDQLAALAAPGAVEINIVNPEDFPLATMTVVQYIIINPEKSDAWATTYHTINNDILSGITPPVDAGGGGFAVNTSVVIPEVISLNTELDRKYYQLKKYPLSNNTPKLYTCAVGTSLGSIKKLTQLFAGNNKTYTAAGLLVEDFIINEATGQIEFLDTKYLAEGSGLFAVYQNYTGLLKIAHKIIDGDLLDRKNYPGIRSAGVKVLVRPAERTKQNVTIKITINADETDLDTASFLAKQLVITYVNNLDIGAPLIVAELIDRAMSVLGVTNCSVITPAADVFVDYNSVMYADKIFIT
jgi:uncharacterized phage protein gp47/JayE